MNFKGNSLSKRSQSLKVAYSVIPVTWQFQKNELVVVTKDRSVFAKGQVGEGLTEMREILGMMEWFCVMISVKESIHVSEFIEMLTKRKSASLYINL
jgi:hypothetical protein